MDAHTLTVNFDDEKASVDAVVAALNKAGLGIAASPVSADGLGELLDLLADGTISGTGVVEGYDQEHIIEAGNAAGSTTTTLRLRIDPIFTYSATVGPGTYSGVTGEGQISATLRLEEDDINPTFPTFVAAFNLAIANDPTQLAPTSVTPSTFLQAINGDEGPSFWFANLLGDQVVVAAVLFFADPSTVQFEVVRDVVLVEYDTIPSTFIDQTEPVQVSLQWQEDKAISEKEISELRPVCYRAVSVIYL